MRGYLLGRFRKTGEAYQWYHVPLACEFEKTGKGWAFFLMCPLFGFVLWRHARDFSWDMIRDGVTFFWWPTTTRIEGQSMFKYEWFLGKSKTLELIMEGSE